MRPIGSRFLGLGNGPLPYPAIFVYFFTTVYILARTKLTKTRDSTTFNGQDMAEFWFQRYNMLFPPNFLNNRTSAHFIEINNIFFCEMIKKYVVARKEILAERDQESMEAHRTKYILNPNYIYEPFTNDTDAIKRARVEGTF